MTFPAAVRGQLPLLAPGPLTVAAWARATCTCWPPGTRSARSARRGGADWVGRGAFLDAAVLRPRGAARACADRRVGRAGLYRGAARAWPRHRGLSLRGLARGGAVRAPGGARRHRAGGGHSRWPATSRRSAAGCAAGRTWSTRWPGGGAGLVRAHALLAATLAPRNAALGALASQPRPDPDEVRRELLAAVGGRTQWQPPTVSSS